MPLAGRKRMMKNNSLKNVWEYFCNILFPIRCPVCDEVIEPENLGIRYIHCQCEKKLFPVGKTVCLHCGRPVKEQQEFCYDCSKKDLSKSFVQGKSLFVYQGVIRKTMYRFKYSNKREYAEFFAKETLRQYRDWVNEKDIETIVPVPMFGAKQKRRGYNQAESFAKLLSKETGIPVEKHLVRRVRDTAPQKELNDVQRKNNLKSAFHYNQNIVQYKKVLLVDDIYTTGSTADAVTEELRKSGAEEVYFLSICIGEGM